MIYSIINQLFNNINKVNSLKGVKPVCYILFTFEKKSKLMDDISKYGK